MYRPPRLSRCRFATSRLPWPWQCSQTIAANTGMTIALAQARETGVDRRGRGPDSREPSSSDVFDVIAVPVWAHSPAHPTHRAGHVLLHGCFVVSGVVESPPGRKVEGQLWRW
jgi:hypothetical protein